MTIIRDLFRHKPKAPTVNSRDADAERKLADAKQQNERADRVAKTTDEATTEFSRILSRVKRDESVFLPGTHNTIGGLR